MKELNKLGKKFNASLPKKQSKRSLGFAMLDDEKSKCMGGVNLNTYVHSR